MDANTCWMYWMRRGEFERAWQVSDTVPGRYVPNRSHLQKKDVLVRCEHGLGDTIQFMRYLDLLRPLARRILVHAQPCMVSLIRSRGVADDVFTWEEAWPHGEYDHEIEIMDLPHAFRTTLATIPNHVPYLSLDAQLIESKRELFQVPGMRNVGLVWSASTWDTRRNIPLEVFRPLASVPCTALFSLQHGPEWRQAVECTSLVPIQNPVEPDNDSVEETAAAIQNLDLVITVDTMVAHLAGALGKPVWVLLCHQSDWRWMLDREDSPWYPTMRLFRQDGRCDWTNVLADVADALNAAVV